MSKTRRIYRKRGGKKTYRKRCGTNKKRGGTNKKTACKSRKMYKGGSGFARSVKPGYPWTPSPSTWPGAPASIAPSACGITASNHYPVSKWGIPAGVGGPFSPNDPPVSSRNLIGGKRRRRGGKRITRRQKGGIFGTKRHTFFPQDIVNLGRSVVSTGQGGIMKWQGKNFPAPYAPIPINNQPIDDPTRIVMNPTGTIGTMYDSAQSTVSQM